MVVRPLPPSVLAQTFTQYSGTCNNHIGMGVRYNAEKKKIGNYYSTPIFSFRCKCHLCDGWFEIQTDPQVRSFIQLHHRLSHLTLPCVEHTICRHVWGEAEGGGLGSGREWWFRSSRCVYRLYDLPHIFTPLFFTRNGSKRGAC